MKHTIWTDEINIENWIDDFGEEMSYEDAEELNAEYLNDERMNLDIPTDGEIICIADLGLWDGRRSAYKLMGHKISNILYAQINGITYNTWYDNGKDICHREAHHDGTNHYVYRILKGKTHDEQIKNAEKLFSKSINARRIGYYTKSLRPSVAKVYGW